MLRYRAALTGMNIARFVALYVGCFVCGSLLRLSFPPTQWGWCVFVVLPLWTWLLGLRFGSHNPPPRIRVTCFRSYIIGLGFFAPILHFTSIVAGASAWLAFSAVEALYFVLWAFIVSYVYAAVSKHYQYTLSIAVKAVLALYIAIVFVFVEGIRGSFPFHGFPWLRLGFPAVNTPLLPLARISGVWGMSFIIATGSLLAWVGVQHWCGLVRAAMQRVDIRRDVGQWLIFAASYVAGISVIALTVHQCEKDIQQSMQSSRAVTVALIQGISQKTLSDGSSKQDIVSHYSKETQLLAADVAHGKSPQPDFVVWPENSSDIDPFTDPVVWQYITDAAKAIHVPVLVGTIINAEDNKLNNSVLVWDPNNIPQEYRDISSIRYTQRYRHNKKFVQPFGEYVPYRAFFSHLSSEVKKANNISPGNDSGVVWVKDTPVAEPICYEVAFDDFFHTALENHGSIIVVPTNNSSFGHSAMTYIQLQMSQFRAVEYGRSVAVAATSGVSAFIAEDGSITQSTHLFTQTHIVGRMRLHFNHTIAYYCEPFFDWVAFIIVCLGVYRGFTVNRLRRRK